MAGAAPAPARTGTRQVFFGRSGEIGSLRARIDGLSGGSGGVVFLTGESGIGKTRLAAEATARARELGYTILWGRCLYREVGLPYHAFAGALKGTFRNLDDRLLAALVDRASRLGIPLEGRLPYLRALLGLDVSGADLTNREQLWDAVLLLLRAIAADRPVVFVLDDLQWSDAETLGLFAYLARQAASLELLLLGIYRPIQAAGVGEAASPLPDTVRQLRIEGAATETALERMAPDDADAAIRALFDGEVVDPALASTIREAAQGNPLFLVELVRLIRSEGRVRFEGGAWRFPPGAGTLPVPERVNDVIGQRLDRVAREDREILELASCEGDVFPSDVLAACLGRERLPLLRRLQALESEHRLIRHEGTRYRFDHPLIRACVYDGILPELREEYHRMIAAHLIRREGSREEAASRIAHHLLASSRESEALPYLVRAAGRARDLHAAAEAHGLYRRAAGILAGAPAALAGATGALAGAVGSAGPATAGPAVETGSLASLRMDIEAGLGDVESSLGNAREAVVHYESFLEAALGAKDAARQCEALRKLADALRVTGNPDRALALAEEAVAVSPATGRALDRAASLLALSLVHFSRGGYETELTLAREALEIARREADPGITASCLGTIGLAHLHRGEYRKAVESLEEALAIQRSIGEMPGIATSLNYLGPMYHRLGESERALACFRESVKIRRGIGNLRGVPGAINFIGETYRDLFDFEKAIACHLESLALSREQGNKGAECDNLRDLGADYMMSGDLAAARRHLEEVLALSQSIGHVWYETRSWISLGELHSLMENHAEAARASATGVEMAEKIGARELLIEALWGRSKVVAGAGDAEEGLRLLARAIELARVLEHRTLLWQLLADEGERLARAGLGSEAGRSTQEARGILTGILDGLRDPGAKETMLGAGVVRGVLASP
jgi:tetratricopeptide (TPR) repeat protein